MNTQHSPGPWQFSRNGDILSNEQPPTVVASVNGPNRSDRLGEKAANKALIAAAPELLNACRALEQSIGLWFSEGSRASGQLRDLRKLLVEETMKQAAAALTKATTP